MTFGPFPSALVNAIQQGYLERGFVEALLNILQYRSIADREVFEGRIGTTITKTRMGLMIPNTTPLNPSTNTGLDNGLTAQPYSDEQYTLGLVQIPQSANPINLIDDETTIASFAVQNATNLGIACATGIDRVARQTLFNAYMGGNTVVTATLGTAGTTISVDDTRGFQTVVANGNVVAVSSSTPLAVLVNAAAYNVVSFTNDGTNVSSAATTGGTSGTLTMATSVSTANGTAGNTVIGVYAPVIMRPAGRTKTAALTSADLLDMNTILNAVNYLRNNAVPTIDGRYHCYLNATSMGQLYRDPEFQILNRGVGTRDPNYANGWIMGDFLDLRFFQTTETYVQPPQTGAAVPVSQTIQRPIICGKGALIESIFEKGLDAIRRLTGGVSHISGVAQFTNVLGEQSLTNGFYMNMRGPIDQLSQIITQTANYVGGFVVPTDVTTTSAIIPTASNAYYKRSVIIETAS